MAVFTMTLKQCVERFPDDIGLNDYPVFEGAPTGFREALNQKIINHYYNREIGMETFSMWRFNMRKKMAEIMPAYNQLYKTELIKFDPLSTMSMESTSKQSQASKSEGNSDSKASSTARSKAAASDFPQTMLDENSTGNYVTSGNDALSTGDNSGSATDKRNDSANSDSYSKTSGYAGAASDLLTAYRATILNIDLDVIVSLEILFMQIWDNGDTFTNNGGYFQ